MLQKKTNHPRAFLKSLLMWPLLAVLVFAFHQKVFSAPESTIRSSQANVADTTLDRYEKLLDKYHLRGDVSPADFKKRQGTVSNVDLEKMSQLFLQLSQTDKDKNRVGFIASESGESKNRSTASGYTMILQFAPPAPAGTGITDAEMNEYKAIFKKYEVVTNGRTR